MRSWKLVLGTLMFALVFWMFAHVRIFADDLQSPNYKIVDATINSTGENTASSSYKAITSIGDFSANPRLTSSSYKLRGGPLELFIANVPKVNCFETVSDGSSACSNGPSYLNNNGMVTVCGDGGCYESARIEIDTQNNPSDTLYSVQISTDNFVSDIKVIDGATRVPKAFSSKTLSDYLTANQWHDYDDSYSTGWTHGYNITGLKPGTQYYVRITALHGDYTETQPSPIATATTAYPTLTFDIDIDGTTGSTTETAGPYSIGTLNLFPGFVVTADNLIWMDVGGNISDGISVDVTGLYGGLHNAAYTINSQNGDLSSLSEGFGLQEYSTTSDYTGSSGELASLTVNATFDVNGDNVGGVSNSSSANILSASGPVDGGRSSLYVKAKSATSSTTGDYTETLTFYLNGQP